MPRKTPRQDFLTLVKSGDTLIAEHQPSPVEDSVQVVARDEGEIEKKNQHACEPEQDSRIEQAQTRTDEANTRTDQAEARSVQAIRASELRYRRLFETAQDGILILDAIPDKWWTPIRS